MAATIITGVQGRPGVVAYPTGLTTGIFNELNFVVPEVIPKIVSKFGNTSYMLASEILGRSIKVLTVLGNRPARREDIANIEIAADDEIIRVAAEIFNSDTVN